MIQIRNLFKSFNDLNVLKETILSEGHAGMTEFSTTADDADDDI